MNRSTHPLFGRLALALGARILGPYGVLHGTDGADQDKGWLPAQDLTHFVIRRAGLDGAGRARLEALGAALHPNGPDHWQFLLPPESLDVPTGTLEALQSPSTGTECEALLLHLAATRRAMLAPPAPVEIMGILNVTPDSFSDGGRHGDPAVAIEAGLRFLEAGAKWLDIGGESTRPGAHEVPLELECERVLPVIAGLAARGVTGLSVDTRHSAVAERALDAGATMVNDVGAGLDDPRMLQVLAKHPCEYVLMHRQGTPKSMQAAPRYGDVLDEVTGFLRERVAACLDAGIDGSRLWVDPGIGFGKRLEHNLDLLRRLAELRCLGLPMLLGPSRKSFIAHVTGAQREADWARLEARDNPAERIGGTSAAITFCVAGGAKVLRVHDVSVMSEACAVASAIQARPQRTDTFPGSLPPSSPC